MKNTKKYSKACERLTYPHTSQDQLYAELNRLGWLWNAKSQQWERNDAIPDPATDLVRVRVWAASDKVEDAAELCAEGMNEKGFSLLEKSPAYICRPPKQKESRIYLTFRISD